MQVTESIHAIKIPFKVSISPETLVERVTFVYLVFGKRIYLIDSGVAGAELPIWEYIAKQGREPKEIATLILTHSHPDHIGAAQRISVQTGCTIFAHEYEKDWIEDVEQQFKYRPVPGFQTFVSGSVGVDNFVAGGEILELEKDIICEVIHTPGHSPGSISLLFKKEKSLFTGDALAFPGGLPIYDDISDCLFSISTLQKLKNIENLFSSWEPPIQGRKKIKKRMDESIAYLKRIHTAVINNSTRGKQENIMTICKKVLNELGLPSFAANPLVAKAFASSLTTKQNQKGAQQKT